MLPFHETFTVFVLFSLYRQKNLVIAAGLPGRGLFRRTGRQTGGGDAGSFSLPATAGPCRVGGRLREREPGHTDGGLSPGEMKKIHQ
jgi:hypothetical protein